MSTAPVAPNTNTAASLGTIGVGSVFSIASTAAPTVYTEIIEISKIAWTGYTIASEDLTNLGSVGAIMEFTAGLINPGSLSIEGNYVYDTTQQAVYAQTTSRQSFPWKIQSLLGNGKTLTLSGTGFFTEYGIPSVEAGKVVGFSSKLQITGVITIAAA
jgi:hypothetical protein